VHLVEAPGLVLAETQRGADARPIQTDAGFLVSDTQTEIESRIRSFARAPQPGREAEPGALGKVSGRRAPKGRRGGTGLRGRESKRHRLEGARTRGALQLVCASLLLAGCAHAPALRSAAEARARVLRWADEEAGATRGEGEITWVRDGQRLGSALLRWASAGESVAAVASVGPVRGLAASLRGESLTVALRHSNLYLAGALTGADGGDARLLRFLVEPWRLGAGWAREALARASVEACEGGYCLSGAPPGDPERRLLLVVDSRGEPVSLTIRALPEAEEPIQVRYGSPRRYAAGRLPRWVEWRWNRSRARLSIDTHSAAGPGLRLGFRPDAEDTLFDIGDPRGRAILRDLFGLPTVGEP
jgi:hypothetical protein